MTIKDWGRARELDLARTKYRCVAVAASLLVSMTAALAAEPATYVTYRLVPDRGHQVTVDNPTDWVYGWGPSYLASNPALTGHAALEAFSRPGEVKVRSWANGLGFGSSVNAGWKDTVSFLSPGREGEHGTVTFAVDYEWRLGAENYPGEPGSWARAYAQTYVVLQLQAAGSTEQQAGVNENLRVSDCDYFGQNCITTGAGIRAFSNQGASVPHPVFDATTAYLSFDVVFGEVYSFDAGLGGLAGGMFGWSSIEAGHSMRWAGITNVVDASGGSLDFSVESVSGFNYAQAYAAPVPEPEQWILMAAGLVALGLRVRGRRVAESTVRTGAV